MRTIDVHTHLMPQCFWHTVNQGKEWYGVKTEAGTPGFTVNQGRRDPISSPKLRFTPEQRLQDMDAQGVDLQVVSIALPLVGYHLPAAQGRQLAREVNDEISAMTRQWPQRFAGLATLPMQDVRAAVTELERAVQMLGLRGAELDTVVNGKGWDEAEFLPLFRAAEQMGALLFYHPQPNNNFLTKFINRYALSNSLGVIVEDTLVASALISGGVLDHCPDLKVCIAHGGGPACYGMGRLDRGWQVRPEARAHILQPPSRYQSRLYYDCITMSEPALRFLIDTVGADRVVLGSDWPYVGWDPSPVSWVQGLASLTQDEKDGILWKNLEALLGL